LKKLFTLFVLLTAATAMFAGEPERRVVVIRDGKVLVDEGFAGGGRRGYVGISMTNLTPELREFFGASKDAGVLIGSVADNSPADKAGLRVGDVVTAINGKEVKGSWDVYSAMADKRSGDSIRFEVLRGKAKQTIVATAEERDLPQMMRAFDLGELERNLKPLTREWRYDVATPDIDGLRARIRELEIKLRELQKRLDK